MAAQEVFKTLRGKEFDIEHAAEGKDHEEAVDSLGSNSAGVGPIGLGLFRREGANGKKRLGRRFHRPQIIPEDTDAPRVTHGLDLLEDTHPAQPRMGFKEGLNLVLEGIELGDPIVRRNRREGLLL